MIRIHTQQSAEERRAATERAFAPVIAEQQRVRELRAGGRQTAQLRQEISDRRASRPAPRQAFEALFQEAR